MRVHICAVGRLRTGPERALIDDYITRFDRTGRGLGLGPLALLPRRDAEHILLLTDTVAADLAADASTMSNLAARPEVYALAGRLADVGAAVRDGDWAAAEASWSAFQTEADTVEARAF